MATGGLVVTLKALASGAVPLVHAWLELLLEAVVPGVMVTVQNPPLAANGVLVLQVDEIVTSLGRPGIKSEYIVGTLSMRGLFELLVRVIVLAI